MTEISEGFTLEDIGRMPYRSRRAELIDGQIVMTATPEPLHQRVTLALAVILRSACPPGHEVFVGPLDYDPPSGDRVMPDVVVVPAASVGGQRLKGAALLIAEIVSPGAEATDRVLRRAVYAEAGVPAYWIVDPARGHILALRLVDSEYRPYADTDGPVTLDWPVAVAFAVAELARPPG